MFVHSIRRNQRDGYNFTQSENSAGNYFPLVTGILLRVGRQNEKLTCQHCFATKIFRIKRKIYK